MSVTLNFAPEKQAALEQLAAAAGMDLSSYIQAVVQEQIEENKGGKAKDVPYEKWVADFEAWIASHNESYNPNFDDSRESIYD